MEFKHLGTSHIKRVSNPFWKHIGGLINFVILETFIIPGDFLFLVYISREREGKKRKKKVSNNDIQ